MMEIVATAVESGERRLPDSYPTNQDREGQRRPWKPEISVEWPTFHTDGRPKDERRTTVDIQARSDERDADPRHPSKETIASRLPDSIAPPIHSPSVAVAVESGDRRLPDSYPTNQDREGQRRPWKPEISVEWPTFHTDGRPRDERRNAVDIQARSSEGAARPRDSSDADHVEGQAHGRGPKNGSPETGVRAIGGTPIVTPEFRRTPTTRRGRQRPKPQKQSVGDENCDMPALPTCHTAVGCHQCPFGVDAEMEQDAPMSGEGFLTKIYTYRLETKTRPCKDPNGELNWITEEVEKEHEDWREDREESRRWEEEGGNTRVGEEFCVGQAGPSLSPDAPENAVESEIVPVPVTRFQELEGTTSCLSSACSSICQDYEPPHRVIQRRVKLTRGKHGGLERRENVEIVTRFRAASASDYQVPTPPPTAVSTPGERTVIPADEAQITAEEELRTEISMREANEKESEDENDNEVQKNTEDSSSKEPESTIGH
ncbi:hypothetical protein SprV_0702290500 [Sparganum proliferum]